MIEFRQTDHLALRLRKRKDARARARIRVRLDRLAHGLSGDLKAVGSGVSELRIDYSPGCRLYFVRHGRAVIVLLAGGDKGTQARDIALAQRLAKDVQVEP